MVEQPPPPDDAVNWRLFADCRDSDPELWFPRDPRHISADMRTTCAHCPVNPECNTYAETHTVYGFWAGTYYPVNRLKTKHRDWSNE